MNINLKGYGVGYVTCKGAQGAEFGENEPIKFTANYTVGRGAAGDEIVGVASGRRGEYVLVQLSGVCTMPYSGTAPTVGLRALVCDGSGGAKLGAAGDRKLLVTAVDTANRTIEVIL